jgi:hypothetical protein
MGSIIKGSTARADGIGAPFLGILLNRDYNLPSCSTTLEGLPANVKTNVALHEIGHILGFEHPPPLATTGVRIPGTAASTNTTGDAASYSTVMESRCLGLTKLSADDLLSVQKKYPAPSCQVVCEFNCTFNVDPAQIGLCQASCPAQCGG